MNKNTKKLLVGTGVFVAGAAAVKAGLHAATHYFMKIALDRKCPEQAVKNGSKISGGSISEEVQQLSERATQTLETVAHTTIEVKSHDGLRLVGHWHPAEQPKRIIIAMHGWRSSWSKDFGMIAPFWHEHGSSVLYAEQRGQGLSEGEYMGLGMLERYDCLQWVQWVCENNPENLPVYLAGLSMGAATVLMAGGLELPECVHGIMADCGFTSVPDIWKHVIENNLHLHYRFHAATADKLLKRKIKFGANECSTVDALRKCKVPVLFIHGKDDAFVPVRMTYENYQACASPKHMLIVPGADHAMSYCVDSVAYQNETIQFWKRYDRL